MSDIQMIEKWEDLQGKTIEAVHMDDDLLFLKLSDNNRAIIKARGGYHAGEADLRLLDISDVQDFELRDADWLTKKEYNQLQKQYLEKQKADREAKERKEYDRLSAKYAKEDQKGVDNVDKTEK